MKLLLFGQIGSGKSHVGALLGREFGLHYHDADADLPPGMVAAIRRHEPLTDSMRDHFADRMIARIAALSADHPRFVVAQALFKDRQRARLLTAFPDLRLVWVRSTPALIAARLRQRTGHLASVYYAATVNPAFEPPSVPHLVLENLADTQRLRLDLARLLSGIGREPGPLAIALSDIVERHHDVPPGFQVSGRRSLDQRT